MKEAIKRGKWMDPGNSLTRPERSMRGTIRTVRASMTTVCLSSSTVIIYRCMYMWMHQYVCILCIHAHIQVCMYVCMYVCMCIRSEARVRSPLALERGPLRRSVEGR